MKKRHHIHSHLYLDVVLRFSDGSALFVLNTVQTHAFLFSCWIIVSVEGHFFRKCAHTFGDDGTARSLCCTTISDSKTMRMRFLIYNSTWEPTLLPFIPHSTLVLNSWSYYKLFPMSFQLGLGHASLAKNAVL